MTSPNLRIRLAFLLLAAPVPLAGAATPPAAAVPSALRVVLLP